MNSQNTSKPSEKSKRRRSDTDGEENDDPSDSAEPAAVSKKKSTVAAKKKKHTKEVKEARDRLKEAEKRIGLTKSDDSHLRVL